MSQRLLVTSALPYANGSIHLGHLVEYIQTDVYVRFRRACGDDVTYVCAADSHGTPIEVNAAKAGDDAEGVRRAYRAEQHEDFQRFGVEFSTYYTTDSAENRRWAYRIYDALKAKGLIYKKSVEQLYCENDRRFLPDRFVKGTCPKCGTTRSVRRRLREVRHDLRSARAQGAALRHLRDAAGGPVERPRLRGPQEGGGRSSAAGSRRRGTSSRRCASR